MKSWNVFSSMSPNVSKQAPRYLKRNNTDKIVIIIIIIIIIYSFVCAAIYALFKGSHASILHGNANNFHIKIREKIC